MPTLLDLCDIEIPALVEGHSMVGDTTREQLYGEFGEGSHSSRMIRDNRYELLCYAVGNHRQLFGLDRDPEETKELAGDPAQAEILQRLTDAMVDHTGRRSGP